MTENVTVFIPLLSQTFLRVVVRFSFGKDGRRSRSHAEESFGDTRRRNCFDTISRFPHDPHSTVASRNRS